MQRRLALLGSSIWACFVAIPVQCDEWVWPVVISTIKWKRYGGGKIIFSLQFDDMNDYKYKNLWFDQFLTLQDQSLYPVILTVTHTHTRTKTQFLFI